VGERQKKEEKHSHPLCSLKLLRLLPHSVSIALRNSPYFDEYVMQPLEEEKGWTAERQKKIEQRGEELNKLIAGKPYDEQIAIIQELIEKGELEGLKGTEP